VEGTLRLVFAGERVIPGDPQCRSLYVEHVARYRFAQDHVRGQRVLDIACGVGYGTSLLAQAGAVSAVGIDVDAQSIVHADEHYGGTPSVRFIQAPASKLVQVAPGPYDVCVSFETIEHLEHPEQFLKDAATLLVPNGLLIISTPNRYVYCPENRDGLHSRNPFHRREWTTKEFLRLLSQHFDVLSVHGQLLLSQRRALLRRWRELARHRVAGTWLEGTAHRMARLQRLPIVRAAYEKCRDMVCGSVEQGRLPAVGDQQEEMRGFETEARGAAVRVLTADVIPTIIVCLCKTKSSAGTG